MVHAVVLLLFQGTGQLRLLTSVCKDYSSPLLKTAYCSKAIHTLRFFCTDSFHICIFGTHLNVSDEKVHIYLEAYGSGAVIGHLALQNFLDLLFLKSSTAYCQGALPAGTCSLFLEML